MDESPAPTQGPTDPVEESASSTTRWSRLTALGWVVAGIAIVASLAITVLGTMVAIGGGEGVTIALAAVPIALAFVALVWPSARLRKPPEPPPDWPSWPTGSVKDKHDGTLGQLLEIARDQANIEEARSQSISARAGWLLGFAGVILALVGAEAKNLFDDAASLGSVGRPLGTWFLIATAVMTAVAAVCALQALLPRPGVRITAKALAGFLKPSIYEDSLSNVRYGQLRVLVEQIVEDRASNERGLDWIKAGFIALVIALLFLLLHVGVYLERTVDSPCSRASGHALRQSETRSDNATRLLDAEPAPLDTSKSSAQIAKLAALDSPPVVESHRMSDLTLPPASGNESNLAGARGPPPCFGTEKFGK